jgi:hypothetical protein
MSRPFRCGTTARREILVFAGRSGPKTRCLGRHRTNPRIHLVLNLVPYEGGVVGCQG